ncbi:hypothetical protein JOD43_000370 [Pullulanibacillus pueri]|nr:hypothetical protein [Pullulanibacillus pueri]
MFTLFLDIGKGASSELLLTSFTRMYFMVRSWRLERRPLSAYQDLFNKPLNRSYVLYVALCYLALLLIRAALPRRLRR